MSSPGLSGRSGRAAAGRRHLPGLSDALCIERVYQNLLAGSKNHLRAFVTNMKAQTGETYAPQYLGQAAYDAIVSASVGQGNVNLPAAS